MILMGQVVIMWVKVEMSGKKWSAGIYRRSAYQGETEQMFLGRYEHTIDEKGRLIIPVRYREGLKNGAYITQGFEKNLVVHTPLTFNKLYEELNQTNLVDPNARLLKRLILSYAEKIELDRVGRFLIPHFLRETAQLKSAVVLVGMGDYFEIWSPDLWEQQQNQMQNADLTSERFAAFKLSTR